MSPISRRGTNENVREMSKMKYARAKRAKLLFFIVKYASSSPRSFCRRRGGCLSFLTTCWRHHPVPSYSFDHG